MAYKVVRVSYSAGGFKGKFKDGEDDTDFNVRSYPELDDYLSMMETRGWTVIGTTVAEQTWALYITLHQPDAAVLGSQD